MRIFAVTFILAAAGCGQVDPCSSHAGVCVGLRVQGSVAALDQLAVSIDKPAPKTVASPVASLHLPLAVALDLPAGTSGAVHVGVIGLDKGRQIAAGSGVATISGNHGSITVTLEAAAGGVLDLSMSPSGDMSGGGGGGGDGGDGGGGGGSTDMAGCGLVTACVNADNCCPSGCNGATDSDCPSVCGNNVVEPSEVCDDGNTISGDGCDQTCRWREKLDIISGYAGDYGHADGLGGYARWVSPMGLAYDATSGVAYVTDQDGTIRKLSGILNSAPTTVTVSGNAYEGGTATGTLAQARYDFSSNGDLTFLGTVLYVGLPTSLRKVDIAGNLVTDVVTGVNVTGVATNGTLVYFVDSTAATGGFKSYNPANGNVATLAAYATLYAGNSSCGHPYCAPGGSSCIVPCGNYVASVNLLNGAVSAFAGTFDSGTGKYTDACTTVNSSTPLMGNALTFSSAVAVTAADATHIYIVDSFCGGVIVYNGSTGYLYSGAGKYTGTGYVEGVPTAGAIYSGPRAMQYIDGNTMLIADSGDGVLRNIGSFVYTVSGAAEHPEALSSQGVSNFGFFWNDVATDGSALYSVNEDGRVAKISMVTGGATTVTPAWVNSPALHDVIYAGGSLYMRTRDGLIQTVKANGTGAGIYAGTAGGVTSPPTDGPRLSAIVNPTGLTTDGTNIYFTDTYKLVRSIDASGMVQTLAGDINSGDNADGTGSAAHFFAATTLTSDGKYLYIADGATYSPQVPPTPTAIRRLNLATKVVDTIAGSVSVSGHVDAVGTAARFGNINGLASDGVSLFIADANPFYPSQAHDGPTIRQLVLATGNVGTMIGTNGQESLVPGVGTVARVHGPTSLIFDATTHSLYFQDNAESVFARIK